MAATADVSVVGAGERLGYEPGLDGLRGLAVAAVLVFHHDPRWLPGGYLGVSLFFTLSGFLITTLLINEWLATGRIALGHFWSRRIRRLFPAAWLGLALALVVLVVDVDRSAARESAVTDIRAALLNVVNWRFIVEGSTYADLAQTPSVVQHFWSLAIEEQFYVMLPLVAVLCLRRGTRVLAAVFVAVIAMSLTGQLEYSSADRIYYGSDTRAAELAVGGLLAIAMPRLSGRIAGHRASLVTAAGFLALGQTLVLWWRAELGPSVIRGGLVLVAIASAGLVWAAIDSPPVRRLLSLRPLVWLGIVSYGVYVYHWPLYRLFASRIEHDGARFAASVSVTLAVAAVSWAAIEQPVRHGGRPQWSPRFVWLALLVVGLVVPATVPRATARPVAAITQDPSRPPRIVVVGDSTGVSNGNGLHEWGRSRGRMDVSVVGHSRCTVLPAQRLRLREGWEAGVPDGCKTLFGDAVEEVRKFDADAVVVFTGAAQLVDLRLGDEAWRHIAEPDLASEYRANLRQALDVLGTAGVPIIWASVPQPSWDPDVSAGGVGPGFGPPPMNDPRRVAALNRLDRAELAGRAGIVLLEFAARVDGGPERRPDGLHFDPEAIAAMADAWLVADLEAAYRTALGSLRSFDPSPNAWINQD